jgi:riboflavin kinase, archaea type
MKVNYPLLFALLRAGAQERHVRLTTGELSKLLGVSQQTSSRWLIEFQGHGYVERGPQGLKLTGKSKAELRLLGELIRSSLEARKKLRVTGEVMAGMRDGRYYMPLPEYRRQFKQKLGMVPYPGTLNVRIRDMEAKLILADRPGIQINGFLHQGRVLGDIKCFPCTIDGRHRGFAILPSRSHYGLDVLELISRKNLRKTLELRDGDTIEVETLLV